MNARRRKSQIYGGLSKLISEASINYSGLTEFFSKKSFEPRRKCSQCPTLLSVYTLSSICNSCKRKTKKSPNLKPTRFNEVADEEMNTIVEILSSSFGVDPEKVKESRWGVKKEKSVRNFALYFSIVYLKKNRVIAAKYFNICESHFSGHYASARKLIDSDEKMKSLLAQLKRIFNVSDSDSRA